MLMVEVRMPAEEKEGTEASVGRWLKQPGDSVEENEPLVEISTDKVTLEIAATASGRLREQRKQAGDAVSPGDVLAIVEQTNAGTGAVEEMPAETAAAPEIVPAEMPRSRNRQQFDTAETSTFSPVVRRLLAELGLDPASIPKVGRGGRLTPEDIRAALTGESSAQKPIAIPNSKLRPSVEETGRLVPHTPMRRSIAAHMAQSVQAAPHVTAVFEADLGNVIADRERRRSASANEEAPSITAYLMRATLEAIKTVPETNSRWQENHLEVFDHVNLGIGTALDGGGLVVPVIRHAEAMDLVALSQSLRETVQKARAGKLTRAEMEGATFTISNHGVGGSLLAAPIILPYGQAAILGAGKVQKRVVVCENGGRDLFRVRPMMYVTLTVDHRVLDAQQTNAFLTAFVTALEASGTR